MHFESRALQEFSVVGIAVRTTNKNGQSQKDIGNLWGKFMSENVAAKVQNKISDNLYCIYTDYESDYMGAYTTILGYQVSSVKNLPEELAAKTVPALTYRCYKSIGKLPDSVVNTWKHIWENNIERKYIADFDLYPPGALAVAVPEVETYLSV